MLEIINSIVQVISYGYVIVNLKQRKVNIKKTKNILLMLIMILCVFILLKLNFGFAKTLIIYSVFTLCYKKIYNISLEESAIMNFICVILHCICEILIVIIGKIIIKDELILVKYLTITPISGLVMLLFIIIIMLILKKQTMRLKELLIKSKVSYIFYLSLVICFAILFSININNWSDKNITSNIMTIIIFGFIIIYVFYEKYKVLKANNKFDKLFTQSQNVASLLKKHKKINHENKNDLRIIREKAKASGNKDIEQYIDELLKDKIIPEKEKWITEITKIKDAGISGFVSLKINEMIDNNMKVIVSISNSLNNYNFDKLTKKEYKDLCRILGVYLDNAYEASKESKEKEITLEMNVNNDILEIILSNTFTGNIDIEKIDSYGYSTKGGSHGTGLSLVNDIISECEYLSQKRKIINNFFYQYLYIDKK